MPTKPLAATWKRALTTSRSSGYDVGADYNLTASATALVDAAGNTFEVARDLGAISAAQTLQTGWATLTAKTITNSPLVPIAPSA